MFYKKIGLQTLIVTYSFDLIEQTVQPTKLWLLQVQYATVLMV